MNYTEFHAAGYKIFPLYGANGDDGEPLPEKQQYKKPRSSGWQHSPLWSQEQLDLMRETGQFDTGYGVLCTGLLVVDVDARNGGIASLGALPVDLDCAGLIVATGSGGGSRHFYFRAPQDAALVQHLPEYPGLDFKSTGFVVGPGSMHESGNRYTIIEGNVDDIDDAPVALIDLLRKPERHRAEYNGKAMDVSHVEIADMLLHVNPDCDHETWIRCGMAVHDATQGTAFHVWNDWSSGGAKYPGVEDLERRWHSFGKSANPVSIGTLIYHAEQGGWQQPVTFEAAPEFDDPAPDPLDTSGTDLTRPPGFCGLVADWINAQCRFPREHLACMAALITLGNVAGLRYTDDIDGVTTNLFCFGVAGSATGKEAVLQACQRLLVETGISAACHGAQKSQQEIIRNLIRHQPAFYLIDEIGIELKKITKSKEAYHAGMVGTMMSMYSKANGFALLSGDVKEEMRAALSREYSQHRKAVEENEDPTGVRKRKMDRIQYQLENLDKGLDRPFLSIIGFTTPETFDDLIDYEQAASGFIGRALLVQERNTNPQRKPGFKKTPMPDQMKRTLQTIYDGGEYDPMNDRIEHYGDRVQVATAPDAVEALELVADHFWQLAEDQKDKSGLEAIPRRAYELVAKVSLILAVPSGLRTVEHVRWAFALVKRDVDEKMRMVLSNDTANNASSRALMAKITKYISSDHGETIGVLRNKLRSHKPEDIQRALDQMEKGGVVRKEAVEHPRNGAKIERWYFVG